MTLWWRHTTSCVVCMSTLLGALSDAPDGVSTLSWIIPDGLDVTQSTYHVAGSYRVVGRFGHEAAPVCRREDALFAWGAGEACCQRGRALACGAHRAAGDVFRAVMGKSAVAHGLSWLHIEAQQGAARCGSTSDVLQLTAQKQPTGINPGSRMSMMQVWQLPAG